MIDVVQLHRFQSSPERFAVGSRQALARRRREFGDALDRLCLESTRLDEAAGLMIEALQTGGRVLAAGNGGSAAEAQHFAAELTGRFLQERAAYAALALTADSATVTAIANDYGFDEIFARQIVAHGRPGDVWVAFSTSGESKNLLRAAQVASEIGMAVIAITGARPNRLAKAADIAIHVPATETTLIQELHTIVLHVLCGIVETAMTRQVAEAAAQ